MEELLHPETQLEGERDLWERYVPEYSSLSAWPSNKMFWVFRMINTYRPLQEKISLFWHGILCTGFVKVDHGRQMNHQIDMFRRHGMGDYRNLLVEVGCQ